MSEWLTEKGRRAAELLGPTEWLDTGLHFEVWLREGAWWQANETSDEPQRIPFPIGNAIQNDHARKRLAEECVVLEIYAPRNHHETWTINIQLKQGERLYFRRQSYESALIAAVLAVFGKDKT